MNDKFYRITERSYENTVEERALLYSMLRQLSFLLKKVEGIDDLDRLIHLAGAYEGIVEHMRARWGIPGRYFVFGRSADLGGIKSLELLDYGDEPDYDGETAEPEDEAEYDPSFFDTMDDLIQNVKAHEKIQEVRQRGAEAQEKLLQKK